MTILSLTTKLSGEYMFEVRGPNGVRTTPWTKNIITNYGLDNYIGNPALPNCCRVGTGTSAPAITQVALDAQIASTNSSTISATNAGASTYEALHVTTYTFTLGAVVGNITEVGVSSATSGNNLFSRSLIMDQFSVPTSLAVGASEQLVVYYRLRGAQNLADVTGTVTLTGTPYNFTVRPFNVASFNNPYYTNITSTGVAYAAGTAFAAITTSPSNALGTSALGGSQGTYVNGNYYRDNIITGSVSQGNTTGGIQLITLPNGSAGIYFQIRFSTPIPKTASNTLSMTARLSFTRV